VELSLLEGKVKNASQNALSRLLSVSIHGRGEFMPLKIRIEAVIP
jgi:hypothetical protein